MSRAKYTVADYILRVGRSLSQLVVIYRYSWSPRQSSHISYHGLWATLEGVVTQRDRLLLLLQDWLPGQVSLLEFVLRTEWAFPQGV
jgi:hypothetical protein